MLFNQLLYWHWVILGIVLITLEIFSPGAFMLWLGLAAGVTGFILWLVPDITWQTQFLLFAVFSVISILAARYWLKNAAKNPKQPILNRRGEQYINRTFTLEEPIVNGQGKIRVDDTVWKIRGSDCPTGTQVKVTGVDGVVLLVEIA